jgi:hypothetical protein
MRGIVFIDDDVIGSANFKVVDESMGAVQGELEPTENYGKYKKLIQQLSDKRGIANREDINLKVILEDNAALYAEGGIGITSSSGFDKILVECAGLDHEVIQKIGGK